MYLGNILTQHNRYMYPWLRNAAVDYDKIRISYSVVEFASPILNERHAQIWGFTHSRNWIFRKNFWPLFFQITAPMLPLLEIMLVTGLDDLLNASNSQFIKSFILPAIFVLILSFGVLPLSSVSRTRHHHTIESSFRKYLDIFESCTTIYQYDLVRKKKKQNGKQVALNRTLTSCNNYPQQFLTHSNKSRIPY